MDPWFSSLAAKTVLSPAALRDLRTDGFVVIPGPAQGAKLAELADAYDRAMIDADPADVGEGATTTRVHDFVNRGSEFDDLYLHAPVLEACCRVIEQSFKLSNVLARTLNPRKPPQQLHVDFASDQQGWPMVGFIFMIDEFRPENGATRFLPGSHGVKNPPCSTGGLIPACGPAGSMIVYNGSAWHGHGANVTDRPRRSLQGAYIRRTEKSFNLAARMRLETLDRISPLAKYLLEL